MMRVNSTMLFGSKPFYLFGQKLYGDGTTIPHTGAKPLAVKQLQDGAALDDHIYVPLKRITDHDQLRTVRDYLRTKLRNQANKASSANQERLTKALSLAILMEEPARFMDTVKKTPSGFGMPCR